MNEYNQTILTLVLFNFNNNNNNNNNVTCIAQIRQSRKCAATVLRVSVKQEL